jgi:hypothetical protein
MNKQNNQPRSNIKKEISIFFLIMEFAIYISFMYFDITGKGNYIISTYLKFIGIILCFLYSIIMYTKDADRTDSYILRGALLFTVISDLFILVLDYYTLGTLTFCIVQIFYLIRLYRWKKDMGMRASVLRNLIRNGLIASVLLCLLLIVKIELESLVIISIFYFVSIIMNVRDAVTIACKSKTREIIIFTFGMVLFLLCDINVGFFNISSFVAIDQGWFSDLYAFATIAMWMFYLPAQVGIALSGDSDSRRPFCNN